MSPSPQRTDCTTASNGALTCSSIFIDSSTITICPAATRHRRRGARRPCPSSARSARRSPPRPRDAAEVRTAFEDRVAVRARDFDPVLAGDDGELEGQRIDLQQVACPVERLQRHRRGPLADRDPGDPGRIGRGKAHRPLGARRLQAQDGQRGGLRSPRSPPRRQPVNAPGSLQQPRSRTAAAACRRCASQASAAAQQTSNDGSGAAPGALPARSSMSRVWNVASRVSGRASRSCKAARLVTRPTTRLSAQPRPQPFAGLVRGSRRARSPWRSASRSTASTASPLATPASTRQRRAGKSGQGDASRGGQEAGLRRPRRRREPRRHGRRSAARPAPAAAARRWRCATATPPGRSPVTASVTGCSTCRRGLTSRKKCSPARDDELDRAQTAVADSRGRGCRRRPASPWPGAAGISTAGASSISF